VLPSAGTGAGWQGYVLPVLSLAALSAGYLALLLREELLVALRAPYSAAARARGLTPWRVTTVHAMRPSLIPVATFLAADLGQLVTGLVIVEGVFRVPGVGGLLFSAIAARDRSLVVGVVTFVAVLVIVDDQRPLPPGAGAVGRSTDHVGGDRPGDELEGRDEQQRDGVAALPHAHGRPDGDEQQTQRRRLGGGVHAAEDVREADEPQGGHEGQRHTGQHQDRAQDVAHG
jgi:hypothetical protein